MNLSSECVYEKLMENMSRDFIEIVEIGSPQEVRLPFGSLSKSEGGGKSNGFIKHSH